MSSLPYYMGFNTLRSGDRTLPCNVYGLPHAVSTIHRLGPESIDLSLAKVSDVALGYRGPTAVDDYAQSAFCSLLPLTHGFDWGTVADSNWITFPSYVTIGDVSSPGGVINAMAGFAVWDDLEPQDMALVPYMADCSMQAILNAQLLGALFRR